MAFLRTKGCLICSAIFAVVAFIAGIVLVTTSDRIFASIVQSDLVITPTSAAFPMWQNIPPLKTSMYIFNVTNPADVSKGALPVLQEVGPYVFEERHEKTKMVWNDANGTVTYQQIRTWIPLNDSYHKDVVTILNPPAATLADMANKELSKAARIGVNLALQLFKEKLFVTKSVKEVLFNGYKDPILTLSEDLPSSLVPVKVDKFAFFYQRNGSDFTDGVFNMYTGVTDINKLGQIYAWNYTHHTAFYKDKCGLVEGAGDFFSPGLTRDHTAEVFSNDLCRPMTLTYAADVSVGGVPGLQYKVMPEFFANKTENPSNWCFNNGPELPSGVYDVGACQFDAPVYTSNPHFFQADPWYASRIASGINPKQSDHETVFVIEPLSGIALSVRARFQVNVLLQKVDDIELFKHVPRVFFPTVWFETGIDLPAEMMTKVWLLAHLKVIFGITGYVLIGAALASVVIVSLFVVAIRRHTDAATPILNTSISQESELEDEE